MEMDEILRMFRDYVSGVARLADLEEWVLSHLQGVLGSGNQEAISIIDKVDSLLIEIGAGVALESELFNLVAGFVNEDSTIRMNLDLDETPEVVFGSILQSINDSSIGEWDGRDFFPHFG